MPFLTPGGSSTTTFTVWSIHTAKYWADGYEGFRDRHSLHCHNAMYSLLGEKYTHTHTPFDNLRVLVAGFTPHPKPQMTNAHICNIKQCSSYIEPVHIFLRISFFNFISYFYGVKNEAQDLILASLVAQHRATP